VFVIFVAYCNLDYCYLDYGITTLNVLHKAQKLNKWSK